MEQLLCQVCCLTLGPGLEDLNLVGKTGMQTVAKVCQPVYETHTILKVLICKERVIEHTSC